ncbi:MAG: hypothetical protein J2P46_07795, partial [Zavarzinella sp.]|nr:hypothetical protein [Zavarzinella sp.]
RFGPGRRYLLRTEYANVGTHPATFEVRFDNERSPAKTMIRLEPTDGQWRTADLRFTAPGHEKAMTYFMHNGAVSPEVLAVRSVRVYEEPEIAPPVNPGGRARAVWDTDFSRADRFRGTMAKPGGLKMAEGRVPDGWIAYVWKEGAAGEVAQEEFAGKTGIAFRTTSGAASAEITTHHAKMPKDTLKAGRRYRADLEYAAPGAGGRLDVRLDDPSKPGDLQVRLTPTGSAWQTVSLEVPVPGDSDRPFSAYVSNFGVGLENTLYVRTLTLLEVLDKPVAAPGPALFRLSADDAKPVRIPTSKAQLVKSDAVPQLPANLAVDSWREGHTGEVAVEDVGGRRAFTLRNSPKSSSVQIRTDQPVGQLQAGHEYVVTVVYWAEPAANGNLDIRKVHTGTVPRVAVCNLTDTGGQWQEATFPFTPGEDCPLYVFVQNTAAGDGGMLAVNRIEVAPVGTAGPEAEPAGGPYRLTLAGEKTFARRYRKDAVVESQGVGDLPAPWAGDTEKADTLGDVFIESVGGQPAIGLRNHQGPPSVRLYSKSALVQAKAGKRYAVKVTYQTEASGKGGVRVAVAGAEAAHGDFEPSVGAWRDVELSLTAAAAGPLTMAVECGSVGSEASIYIKGIEVSEQP